ncbi:MAG TPA: protein-glutamate O-methyltransferase CheR, partial [Anaerolineae bacterium]|nr:protein-glutamate O-methyltransferase CheR [Anaerolineae bacterium]HIQ04364.1 protein-glutamate O-methyltransferase CheR [Anaerolineae bacterium]
MGTVATNPSSRLWDAGVPELPSGTFRVLRDLIYWHTGILYHDNQREILASKLAPLVLERGFDSFLDYYYFLKYDPAGKTEMHRVVDTITVQESYFFREPDQLNVFIRHVVPDLLKKPRIISGIRIWSAGCAAGEEPYSLAILLLEAGVYDQAQVEILATDISRRALATAREGRYRPRALQRLPESLRNKYFTRENDLYRISETVKEKVTFTYLNLLDERQMHL